MDFQTIRKRVALAVQDPLCALLSDAIYGYFVNDAIDDLKAAGWLLPLAEDESTTMATNTYEYDVPASFAFIYQLWEEDDGTPTTYSAPVPDLHWRMSLDASSDPEFHFDPILWSPRSGKTIKVVGQQRPAALSEDEDDLEGGMEPFIRERSVYYAARTLAGMQVTGEHRFADREARAANEPPTRRPAESPDADELRARRLMQVADRAWATSERFLSSYAAEFRVRPSSRHVPGR